MAKKRKKKTKKVKAGNGAAPFKNGEVKCRVAVRTDIAGIFRLLKSQETEIGPWNVFTPDYAKALGFIAELLEVGIILVAEMDGKIVGSVGAGPQEFFFSRDVFLCDYWTIVHKDYRRSTVASELLVKLKEFQEKVGIPLLVGVFSVVRSQAKMALYRRHFEPMGAVYAKGFIDTGDKP